MNELLKALRGARLIASGHDDRWNTVYHWLLPNGSVLELVRPRHKRGLRH